jgi:hypothetical protein
VIRGSSGGGGRRAAARTGLGCGGKGRRFLPPFTDNEQLAIRNLLDYNEQSPILSPAPYGIIQVHERAHPFRAFNQQSVHLTQLRLALCFVDTKSRSNRE